MVRLLPSLKPLAWHNLSEAVLQSGAPFVETGQIIRPVTIEGLARRDNVSVASLVTSFARSFRSPMVSPGLFSGGSFPNIFPISLIRPGFSRAGGVDDGGGSPCAGAG